MAPRFALSEPQAEGVLSLTLRRLTGLEAARLRDEAAALAATIADLEVRVCCCCCCCCFF